MFIVDDEDVSFCLTNYVIGKTGTSKCGNSEF